MSISHLNNIYRLLCLILYYSIGRHFPTSPVPGHRMGHAIRRKLFKGIVPSCGTGVIIEQNCHFGKADGLRVGNRSMLGDHARIGPHVTIGDDVIMGPDVVLMTTAHAFEDPNQPINRQGFLATRPIKIGNDVWLGTRVIVMPGVQIGDGAVIGSGSIVTHDIPTLSVAAGAPARVIRKRGSRPPVDEIESHS